ncbi:MAG: quinone oxidoreductase [Pseudomonadota bacterium]
MSTITAIRLPEPGDAEAMRLSDIPLPSPGEGEILVRHRAIGVNYIDTYHRSGLYPLPLPTGIGLEAAGTVESIGPNSGTWSVGDRIAYCTGPIGAYAEAHVIKADRGVRLPKTISFDAAASIMLKGLTTQYLIRQIYRAGPKDTVLFHAAAGGVGQIAVQWLKHLGSTVIATVGSQEKADLVTRLGADHIILYGEEDTATRVREIVPEGLPVVYDGVGQDTFVASLNSLKPKGLMVSFGNASGPVKDVDLGILAAKGSLFLTRPTLFNYTATSEDLQNAADDLFAAIDAGGITPPSPTVYPLSKAVQAHQDLEARKTTGSLILRP